MPVPYYPGAMESDRKVDLEAVPLLEPTPIPVQQTRWPSERLRSIGQHIMLTFTVLSLPFFVIAWTFILVPPALSFLNSALAKYEVLRTILVPMTWTLIPSLLILFFGVMVFAQLMRQAQVGCIPKKFGDVILKMVGELRDPAGQP